MSEHEENPLEGYYEWQVTTLMLAYDLHDPLTRDKPEAADERRDKVQRELGEMVMSIVPQRYKDDPTLDWPPELMRAITRATLLRAAEIVGG
jgi:hypothetical protein